MPDKALASANEALLRVVDLGYETNGDHLLSGIFFSVLRGHTTVILGPNGAGKSLLLRLCHGLLAPTRGTISWHTSPATPGRRAHAMVFQKPVMLRRSVLGNLTHALAAAGMDRQNRRKRAVEALERFGLSALADRPARVLSGGEQQRLAIARAWSLAPEVLFLDEPTAALDPSATRQVETMLSTLREEGVTLVMTTHDLGQARRLADDVVMMVRGRVVETAPGAHFFDQPKSAQARAFLAGELLW
jgi:tungstate transport system ATP-binding protein